MPKIILKNLRGINASKAALQLPPGDVPFMQNVRTRPFMNWAKRKGIDPVAVYDSAILGIFEAEFDNSVFPIFQTTSGLVFNPSISLASGATASAGSLTINPNAFNITDGRGSQGIDPQGIMTQVDGADGDDVPNGCVYVLDDSSVDIDNTQQDITISVDTYIGCSWNAVSNNAWLTTQSGSAHLSSGNYTVRASANSSYNRVGTISFYRGSSGTSTLIGTFTVNQTGNGLTQYTITGAPLTEMKRTDIATCQGNALLSTAPIWDGTVAEANPGVRWDSSLFWSWQGYQLVHHPTNNASVSIFKDFYGAGTWLLSFGDTGGGPTPFEANYKKIGGATPAGVYLIDLVTNCGINPASYTVT